MPNGMGKSNVKYLSFIGYPDDAVLENIIDLYTLIFNDADVEFFNTRLKQKEKSLCALAYNDNKLIGFKIGYPYDESTFYSWIGGVLPNFRQLGVAAQLAKLQENYAIENGFSRLKSKSMNKYKPMMVLNLKNGFDITEIYTNAKGQTKIVFEKKLI